ncbi:MAG: right-handed parallel beta-helix repeat-containing protein [Verrucomicrobiota bacterium]
MSIPRFTAVSAMVLSAPLAVFGIHSIVTSIPRPAAPHAIPQVTRSADGRRAEIRVPLGTGDDIARAIAALPPSGGRVILEAGIYTVRQPLVLDRDDIEVTGDQEQTVLQLADRADCPLVVIGPMETPPSRKVSGIALRKVILDGNRATQDNECNGGPCDNGGLSFIRNNALTVRAAEDVRIERVTARRARSGGIVLEKGCRRIHVSDFTSYDNHYDGFAAYETEESFFTRLYLHSNAAAGISADLRFDRNIISYARLENNGSQGIFMRDSNFNNFNHLTITGNGAQGVFIAQSDDQHTTPCTGNIFSELAVSKSKGAGLRVNDVSCVANVLANSSFTGNGEGGVSEASERLLARQNVDLR